MANVTLSEKEIKNIFVNLLCNKLFILAPLYFKQISGFSTFFVTTIVFAFTFLIWKFYCDFSVKSINTPINSQILQKLFIVLIVVISTTITAVTIRQYSFEIKASVLHKTPLYLISTIFLTIILLSVKFKIKSIGSASVVFVPAIYFIAVTLILLSINRNDLYNFFPIVDTSNNAIFQKVSLMLSMLFEIIFIFFLPHLLEDNPNIFKVGKKIIFRSYINYLIIGIVFSIVLPEFANENTEPFFKIIKQAHLMDTNIKLDSIFLILYCISGYIYVSSMFLLVSKITEFSFSKLSAFLIKIACFVSICTIALISNVSEFIFEIFSKYYFILSIISFMLPIFIITANKVLKCKSKE